MYRKITLVARGGRCGGRGVASRAPNAGVPASAPSARAPKPLAHSSNICRRVSGGVRIRPHADVIRASLPEDLIQKNELFDIQEHVTQIRPGADVVRRAAVTLGLLR